MVESRGRPCCDLGVSVSEGLEPAAVSEADFDPGIACWLWKQFREVDCIYFNPVLSFFEILLFTYEKYILLYAKKAYFIACCDLGVSVSEGLEPAAVSEADFDPGIACWLWKQFREVDCIYFNPVLSFFEILLFTYEKYILLYAKKAYFITILILYKANSFL